MSPIPRPVATRCRHTAGMGAIALVALFWLGGECVRGEETAALKPGQRSRVTAATRKANRYLAGQVAAWRNENGCYSCHNHGDGMRALLRASRGGIGDLPAELEDSLRWLRQPHAWHDEKAPHEFHDEQLATLQFGYALATLLETPKAEASREQAATRQALKFAARRLQQFQRPDGSWRLQVTGLLGSPITYGPHLGTVVALRVLRAADRASEDRDEPGDRGYDEAVLRGEQWLASQTPRNVMTAAALLWGLCDIPKPRRSDSVQGSIEACLELLEQSRYEGAWGPYRNATPEPFDTALVLLAMQACRGFGEGWAERVDPMIAEGLAYLVDQQQADGGWLETTRPAGATSYAHRISTTAWVLEALVACTTTQSKFERPARAETPEPSPKDP